jgi:hypothetical protein
MSTEANRFFLCQGRHCVSQRPVPVNKFGTWLGFIYHSQYETIKVCRYIHVGVENFAHTYSGANQEPIRRHSGANPKIVSYNASAVKNCSAPSTLERFEYKNIFFYYEKRSSLLQRWRCSCKFWSLRIGFRWNVSQLNSFTLTYLGKLVGNWSLKILGAPKHLHRLS